MANEGLALHGAQRAGRDTGRLAEVVECDEASEGDSFALPL